MLMAAHRAGRLRFSGVHAGLADPVAFASFIAPLRKADWVVYAKAPFGGPEAVLAYAAPNRAAKSFATLPIIPSLSA